MVGMEGNKCPHQQATQACPCGLRPTATFRPSWNCLPRHYPNPPTAIDYVLDPGIAFCLSLRRGFEAGYGDGDMVDMRSFRKKGPGESRLRPQGRVVLRFGIHEDSSRG